MTPTPEEIKAAREEFGALTWPSAMGEDIYHVKGIELKHLKIIDFALRFTEKMMGEPSEGMHQASEKEWDGRLSARRTGLWVAMRDQAVREMGNT